MDINAAAVAVERFLAGYQGPGGRTPVEVRVHPSGDDVGEVKAWVDLGAAAAGDDLGAWCAAAEAALRAAVPGLDGLTLHLRADAI